MDWEKCKERNIKEVKPNKEKAKSLLKMAEKRLEFVEENKSKNKSEFIVENYYEVIKELITSLLSLKGYKSYNHLCLIFFLRKFYPQFQEEELELIDQMRRIRNDIMYRGEPIATDYLKRRKREIIEIIEKLTELAEEVI